MDLSEANIKDLFSFLQNKTLVDIFNETDVFEKGDYISIFSRILSIVCLSYLKKNYN